MQLLHQMLELSRRSITSGFKLDKDAMTVNSQNTQPFATELLTVIRGNMTACAYLNDRLDCANLGPGGAFAFAQALPLMPRNQDCY